MDYNFLDKYKTTTASRLYGVFREWFQENISKKVLSQKRFGSMMKLKFERTREGSGRYVYHGVGLLNDEPFEG